MNTTSPSKTAQQQDSDKQNLKYEPENFIVNQNYSTQKIGDCPRLNPINTSQERIIIGK